MRRVVHHASSGRVSTHARAPRPLAGMNSRRPCGKGPGRSTSLAWSRGGVCRWVPRTTSSEAASHGRCTLAWPNYNPPPWQRPTAELGPLAALDPLSAALEPLRGATRGRQSVSRTWCHAGTPPSATRSSVSSRRRTSRAGSRPTSWTATPSARRWRAPSTRGLPTTRRSTSRT